MATGGTLLDHGSVAQASRGDGCERPAARHVVRALAGVLSRRIAHLQRLRSWPHTPPQTTRGSDAHPGAPDVRTRRGGGNRCTQRSCAPLFRTVGAAGSAKAGAGSDPAVRGTAAGSGPCAFAHPRPLPLGSLPDQRSLRGKAVRAPLRGGGAPVRRPAGRRAVRHRRPRPGRGGRARQPRPSGSRTRFRGRTNVESPATPFPHAGRRPPDMHPCGGWRGAVPPLTGRSSPLRQRARLVCPLPPGRAVPCGQSPDVLPPTSGHRRARPSVSRESAL